MTDRRFVVTSDVESMVAFVKRAAVEACDSSARPVDWSFDECARDAVSSLRASRITTFVPLLALCYVRCCIRASRCDRGDCSSK
jgi:hypothetical protein